MPVIRLFLNCYENLKSHTIVTCEVLYVEWGLKYWLWRKTIEMYQAF